MAERSVRVSDRGGADSSGAGGSSMEDRVTAVELAWKQIVAEPAAEHLSGLETAVHQLVDAADSLGYPKVAELASMVEVMLAPVISGDDAVSNEFSEILRDYLKALHRLSRQAPVQRPPAETAKPAAKFQTQSKVQVQPESRDQPRVCLLEPNRVLAKDLVVQIEHFGYKVQPLVDVPGLLAAIDEAEPYAIVIDLPELEDQLADFVNGLRARAGARLPVVVICEQGDVEARLRAARAGADAYLVKPFDLHELIDQLDRMGTRSRQEPFHIVIVEDSSTQAIYYSAVLKKAGMATTVVNDPLRVLDVMNENAADLLLMDMYMPHCNGMELAKVIRQVPRFASIPIVFLSAETEIERQLDALSLGGDDFLTKPINPAHLIRSVAIRAERARTLRTFMLTDTLTGLLNHTRIKEQLQNEVARAARNGSTFAFAMVDIDHFKQVNDTHGHHVGDRVIKTLSRVLQQRLRQTDYIGRYGGEEFAVILPDADQEEAVSILDDIRHGFGKIHQISQSGVFKVTFSAGVACFPASDDAVKLALRADKALYAAKRAGRTCIVPYSASLA